MGWALKKGKGLGVRGEVNMNEEQVVVSLPLTLHS